jgi:hypothetical protein
MGLRDRLRRLEEAAEGEMLVIPQRDGTVKKFPKHAGEEAFMNLMDRLGAGEEAPPEHPLIEAARSPSASEWAGSFFAVEDPGRWVEPVPDLSD